MVLGIAVGFSWYLSSLYHGQAKNIMPITYCLAYPVLKILGLRQNCKSINKINEFTCVCVQEEVIICFEANNSYLRFGGFFSVACKINHL